MTCLADAEHEAQATQAETAIGTTQALVRLERMADRSFDEGYRDGWESVAGKQLFPANPTQRAEGDADTYECGFRYGKSEAAERFKPTGEDCPPPVRD